MDWEKIINWDEVPEDMRIYQHRKTKALHPGPVLEDSHFEELKRPIELEDKEWYTFTYQGVNNAGMFLEHDNTIRMGNIRYSIAGVKIHKKLPNDMWE